MILIMLYIMIQENRNMSRQHEVTNEELLEMIKEACKNDKSFRKRISVISSDFARKIVKAINFKEIERTGR